MITRGVYSATCSILNDDHSLNVDATIAHAAETINNGLHGVIFFGSTGQSQLISISEKKDLIAKISSHKLRKHFFLGTGCNSLNETVDLIKYGFDALLSSTAGPANLITKFGIFSLIMIFIFLIFILINKFFFNPYEGFSFTIILILFLFSLNTIMIGIIGEYITRIYNEVKQRPNYIIEEIIER